MIRRSSLILAAALALSAASASAHPHVFVTSQSAVIYEDGAIRAVRHAWRFDDMFSAFASQGLDTDGDGSLSRAELQELAEVNVTSLKEFDFFTFGKSGGGDISFGDPVDYYLSHDGTALTLHFTLPVAQAQQSETVELEVYDPSYFVAFDMAPENPATLEGGGDGCRIDMSEPAADTSAASRLTEEFFADLDPTQGWGAQFASVITVRCGDAAVAYAESLKPPPPPEPEIGPLARVEQALAVAGEQPLAELPIPPQEGSPLLAPQPGTGALGAFGVVRPDGVWTGMPSNAVFGWIAQKQSEFYKKMSGALTASKADGSAFLLLVGLSFLYGIFHAAGPGHGKAVISAYLLASGETLRRGIAISFASAFAQAVTAVAVVGLLVLVLGATSRAMGVAAWWLEAASYGLIVLLGVGLLFRRSLFPQRGKHVHDETCAHNHGPSLEDLEGPFGWRRALAAVLAVGLRPCTGALLVLVFAIAQGLLWTGVASTFAMALGTAITVSVIAGFAVLAKNLALRVASGSSSKRGRRLMVWVEVAAGFAVLCFGLMLLGGLLASGPVTAG